MVSNFMEGPRLISGNKHTDQRGTVRFNNEFDATQVKRIYIIENADTNTIRAWQGHRVEQRWFSAISGSFKVQLIQIDDWEKPSNELPAESFILHSKQFAVLHIPAGFVSSIQALEEKSRLLVMADTFLGEMKDEYRFPADYFNQ
jgi:dTDP-4-dehydrorhamnose 3,5-epimerase-like enzyme